MQEEMKLLDSYTSFAYVYDTFMDQEPYDRWADRVCAFLDEFGLPRITDISARDTGKPLTDVAAFLAAAIPVSLDTRNSLNVFQFPQLGHFPIHFDDSCPQFEQTYAILSFAISHY